MAMVVITGVETPLGRRVARLVSTDPSTEVVGLAATGVHDLPERVSDQVRELAASSFAALGCEGLARVDFFVTDSGHVTINEVNTMPGFTPYSMYPLMWERSGLSYGELLDELIALALERSTGLR